MKKQASVFSPRSLVERAQANAARFPRAAAIQQEIIGAAQPWLRLPDEALWSVAFGFVFDVEDFIQAVQ